MFVELVEAVDSVEPVVTQEAQEAQEVQEALEAVEEIETEAPYQESPEEKSGSSALKVIGWLSVGVAVAAVGVYVGRELHSRYKFNHRNPYEFYAHAGEQPGEFGVGV